MKRITIILALLAFISLSATDKYAGEIFNMGASVRNFALGGTGTADIKTSALAYFNSSLLTLTDDKSKIELMHANEYSGLLSYDSFNLKYKNNFALTITRIGIDDIPLTKLEDPSQEISGRNRPYAYKNVNNSDIVAYAGFARKINNKLSIGLTPKFAYRNLAEETAQAVGVDVSTHYKPFKNVLLGLNMRDITGTYIFWSNGTNEIVNPGFELESAIDFVLPKLNKNVTLYLGCEGYSEGREEASTTSIGAFSLDYHAGLDLEVIKNQHVLLGYDIENVTAGLSLLLFNLRLNYAFEHNTELDNSHRVSIEYEF